MQGTRSSGLVSDYKVGLTRVRAGSPTNIWAIGILSTRVNLPTFGAPSFGDSPDFIAHWNGRQWSEPKPPPPGGAAVPTATPSAPDDLATRHVESEYKAVEVVGAIAWLAARINDFRCEGSPMSENSCWHNYPYAEVYRWHGGSWEREMLPESQNALVYDMLALSETDVWAVGVRGEEGGRIVDEQGKPWAWHWDGTAWTSTSQGLPQSWEPTSEKLNELGIAASGGVIAWGDTWDTASADVHMGTQYNAALSRTQYEWDGNTWKAMPGYSHPELTRPGAVSLQRLSSSLPGWESYKDAQKLPDGTIWAVGGYSGYGVDGRTNDLSFALAARFTPGPCPK